MRKRFGIVGEKLVHTISPQIYNTLFVRNDVDAVYEILEISRDEFDLKFKRIVKDLEGYNVTIPYKNSVLSHLKEVSEHAKRIGAVNTVDFKEKGYNTDWLGFEKSLKNVDFLNKKALVFGAGGAARAVCYALKKMEFDVYVVNRTVEKAKNLSKTLNVKIGMPVLSEISLVVNATPLGMYPNVGTMPPIHLEKLPKRCIVYDLVYNPYPTLLLKKAREKELRIVNGLEMLIQQAILNLRIWNLSTLAEQLEENYKWVYELI